MNIHGHTQISYPTYKTLVNNDTMFEHIFAHVQYMLAPQGNQRKAIIYLISLCQFMYTTELGLV